MYHDLKEVYWLKDIKKNVTNYVELIVSRSKLSTCPDRLAQKIEIPLGKREMINMDFVTCLTHSFRKYDSIRVIVD